MRTKAETPEEKLEKCEDQLGSLHSYLHELKAMTDKHGTDRSLFEEDLLEAEHNIEYYEHELEELKDAAEQPPKAASSPMTKAAAPQAGTDTILPKTAKQGIGSLIFSSISFIAGALLGSRLKSRKAGKGGPEEK